LKVDVMLGSSTLAQEINRCQEQGDWIS
jgi:hypothetical protein